MKYKLGQKLLWDGSFEGMYNYTGKCPGKIVTVFMKNQGYAYHYRVRRDDSRFFWVKESSLTETNNMGAQQ